MCDMTHSYIWRDSCVCVTWLIFTSEQAYDLAWTPSKTGTGWQRLIRCLNLEVIFRKRATNYRALLRKMTNEARHPMTLCHPVRDVPCVTWLIHMCDMTHSYYVTWLVRVVWHDIFICATWLILTSEQVYDLAWTQSKTGTECATVSTDGQLFFWCVCVQNVLTWRSFSAKEPLIIGLFCGKWPMKIRHPCLQTASSSSGVYVCVCVCVYVCVYVYVWMCHRVYRWPALHLVCMCVYVYVCMCVCICVCMCMCACACVSIDGHLFFWCVCMCMSMCVCICVCMCMCAEWPSLDMHLHWSFSAKEPYN